MQKFMYSAFAAVAVVLMAAVFTSCEKEEKEEMVCTVQIEVKGYVYNLSPEVKSEIEKTIDELDARAKKILGETFRLPLADKETARPTKESVNNCFNRLDNDKEFTRLVDKLYSFKTLDGDQAVTNVTAYIYCGTKEIAIGEF